MRTMGTSTSPAAARVTRPAPVCARCARPAFAIIALSAALGLAAFEARAEDLLDQYSATDRFRGGQPRAVELTPDGGEALFLRSGPRTRVNDLWACDTRTGRERVVLTAQQILNGAEETLTPEERARRERLRLSARGIATFQLSRDGRRLLVPLSGRLFVVERASSAVKELSPGAGPADDPRFSPDGEHVACVRGGDLCVIDLASGAERKLTRHEGNRVTWGLPEFVAQEEMDRFEGYWWSPDSRWLAVQRTDETNVERLRIADPSNPVAEPQEWAYPRPGRENAEVRLALIPASGGEPRFVDWDRARWPYLCTVRWDDGAPLTLLVMNRDQSEESVLACDAATGVLRALLDEHDDKWLNLEPSAPRWLAGGRQFLWIAERDDSGPWLELRGAAGLATRLTPRGLRVHSLLAVDDPHGVAYVSASSDAREEHVWRVWLRARRAPERLTREPGLHTATFSRDGSTWVDAVQPMYGVSRWNVMSAGRVRCSLRSLAEKPPFEPRVEWTIVGPDSMAAVIVRPHDFDARRKYPVIDWAYAGPHSLRVQHRANGYVLDQWLADQGFIVVTVDGHGTPWRGRSWERAIRGDLIGPALADHEAGIRALCAGHPEMDVRRVGVVGWSFGGYFVPLALERASELYKVGVAGAPVVDWRDYDTFYTERYLGLPQRDSAAYARSSVLTDIEKLARPLLVIHGTADDNVYFFHSLKLADALNRAGKSWDFLPLPGQTHAVFDPAIIRQIYTRTAEFFTRELGPPGDTAPQQP